MVDLVERAEPTFVIRAAEMEPVGGVGIRQHSIRDRNECSGLRKQWNRRPGQYNKPENNAAATYDHFIISPFSGCAKSYFLKIEFAIDPQDFSNDVSRFCLKQRGANGCGSCGSRLRDIQAHSVLWLVSVRWMGGGSDCTACLLTKYPLLKETPSTKPEQRTAWNVRDSHASLIIVEGSEFDFSRGTAFTIECATLIFMRPCHIVDTTSPDAVQSTRDWLVYLAGSIKGRPLVLNIAGPRESERAGTYAAALEFLSKLFV